MKKNILEFFYDHVDEDDWLYGLDIYTSGRVEGLRSMHGLVTAKVSAGGPRGEELFVFYWWVVPLVMTVPAWVAFTTWLDRWALTTSQLILRSVPFALAVGVWIWVACLPT